MSLKYVNDFRNSQNVQEPKIAKPRDCVVYILYMQTAANTHIRVRAR